MKINEIIKCEENPCEDIMKGSHFVPDFELDPNKTEVIMIAEALPEQPKDYFYSKDNPEFMITTIQAFQDAEQKVQNIDDIIELGFYLTAAVKCSKVGYSVPTNSIKTCSFLLEKELDMFPNIKVIMLMGDVAIRALNYIAKRKTSERAVPAGSTYKIRKNEFYWGSIRVFPSYLMTGKNYLIEKSKRRMIAEDIKNAIEYTKK